MLSLFKNRTDRQAPWKRIQLTPEFDGPLSGPRPNPLKAPVVKHGLQNGELFIHVAFLNYSPQARVVDLAFGNHKTSEPVVIEPESVFIQCLAFQLSRVTSGLSKPAPLNEISSHPVETER